MAAAATLTLTLIQTTTFTTFVNLVPPNQLVLPSPPPPSPSSYYCRNKCNNNQRWWFRLCSSTTTPKPSTSTYIPTSTRKPISLYLIENLGFSEEHSLSISKRLLRVREYDARANHSTDLISFDNADNVISYLRECCGLDLSHIRKVITKYPKILTSDVDKTLKPKITLLQNSGFSTSDIAHCLSRNPALYLKTDLTPAIQALRGILGSDSDEYVVKVFKGLNYGSANNIIKNLIPNVTMLENEYGISKMRLRDFLCSRPIVLMLKTEIIRDVIVKVEDKWGISRDSTEFLRAVRVFCGLSEVKINSKCQVFRSYGWSDSDILSMIRRQPTLFTSSEARLNKSLDFYMIELGYDPAYLASQTVLLSCSLENRVVPRHRVLSILKEKLLIKADYQLDTAIRLTDNKFFDRFIRPFKNEVPELRQLYINGGEPTEELKHFETFGNEPSTLVALE